MRAIFSATLEEGWQKPGWTGCGRVNQVWDNLNRSLPCSRKGATFNGTIDKVSNGWQDVGKAVFYHCGWNFVKTQGFARRDLHYLPDFSGGDRVEKEELCFSCLEVHASDFRGHVSLPGFAGTGSLFSDSHKK